MYDFKNNNYNESVLNRLRDINENIECQIRSLRQESENHSNNISSNIFFLGGTVEQCCRQIATLLRLNFLALIVIAFFLFWFR